MFFPLKNWKSWLYFSFGLLTIVWIVLYFHSGFTGFIAACAICIGLSVFSIYDFRDIFYLKEQIAITEDLNQDFVQENEKMELSIQTIEDVNTKLEKVVAGFAENNAKLSANIKTLEKFVHEFEEKGDGIKEGESAILDKCTDWIKTWRSEASDNVRRVLTEAFKAIEVRDIDGQKGLNVAEYQMFLKSLPDDYRAKIENKYKTFDEIDNQLSRDGNIDKKEFKSLMNVVCDVDD